jgi:hypothetical protein
LLQKPIDDRIANAIAEFIWVSLRDGFAGKHEIFFHGNLLSSGLVASLTNSGIKALAAIAAKSKGLIGATLRTP